jgi:hypothetical protein
MSAKIKLFAAAAAATLSGCAVVPPAPTALTEEVRAAARQLSAAPARVQAPSRVEETAAPYIPVEPRTVGESDWLRTKRVTIEVGARPVPLAEVLRVLARQGVNITSELPLERFTYAGFSLTNVDAQTALRMVLSASGLDYYADESRQLVTVRPMALRTWFLNLGNRSATFASGGAQAAAGSGQGAGQGAAGGSAGATLAAGGASTIRSSDDFWASLRTELESRLEVLVPETPTQAATPAVPAALIAGLPGLPGLAGLPPVAPPPAPGATRAGAAATPAAVGAAAGAAAPATAQAGAASTAAPSLSPPSAAATSSALVRRTIGTFSLNPETGAVTVQAPHWVLADLDSYLKRVQDMYNTDIVFQGELLMLSVENTRSEGLDISSFARFANNRYGLVVQNNALGGVTVSIPAETAAEGALRSFIPAVAAGNPAVAGPLIGVRSALSGLQLFSGYLSTLGQVTTLQRPVLTTTSGVPADFRRTVTRHFNSVTQQAAAGGAGGGAAVGTVNQLVPMEFGTILRVNPRIDMSTGLIRAQIELVQTTQVGTQTINQSLTAGDAVTTVATQVPVVSRILYSGEALLRDGDLVVMGGQTESRENATHEGIPGLAESPAGAVFARATQGRDKTVFYFALKVSTQKRR